MDDVNSSSGRVLIIDDDDLSREVLKEILGELGYSVLEAATGEAGLDAFRSHPVALVITDFQLPGTTGREVASRIKEADPGIPIILMTGRSPCKDWLAGDACFDFVLHKPCPFPLLIETVEKALSDGRSMAG